MSQTLNSSPNPPSDSDSFFGMALAQAFLGFAYGPVADQIWDAGEISSAVYADRKGGNGAMRANHVLGRGGILMDGFARAADIPPLTGQICRPASYTSMRLTF